MSKRARQEHRGALVYHRTMPVRSPFINRNLPAPTRCGESVLDSRSTIPLHCCPPEATPITSRTGISQDAIHYTFKHGRFCSALF
jgi:hypothetical protein